MRAAGGTAFLGVSPFWIRHGKFLFLGAHPGSAWVGIFRSDASGPDRLYRETFSL
jgi:hypothetical protein